MRLEPFLAFAVYSAVTTVTPGPNNVMLTATGASVGFRRGLPHLFGINVGFGLMQLLFIGGVGTAVLALPTLTLILKLIGIAILVWLSWKIATAKRVSPDTAERPIGFYGAAAFQCFNPKAWLICAGAVSFLQPNASPALQAAIFVAISIVIGIPSMMMWLGFGATMQRFLRTDRAFRIFSVVMALALIATIPLLL